MYYIALKGGIVYAGWGDGVASGLPKSEPLAEGWLAGAEDTARRILGELRSGRVEASPAEPANCRFCDFRDVCRVTAREALAAGEEG